MNIAVIGVGAIGGWLAARLALAGHQVTCVTRGKTLAALQGGLVLREGGREERAMVRAVSAGGDCEPQDLLILATKATALAEAATAAEGLIGADTLVLPLQNGVPWWFLPDEPLRSIDPDGRIAASLPERQVIGAVVHAACRRTAPATVEVVHADKLILGEPAGGQSERVGRLAAMLESAGIRVERSTDVRRAIWYKLWGNMTINPLSALTGATADRLIGSAELKPFILQAMAEAAAIGAAIGCPIEQSGEERMAVTARLGAFKTSMLQDAEAGRPLELEALVGAPREIARRVGVETPAIDALHAMARLMAETRGLL